MRARPRGRASLRYDVGAGDVRRMQEGAARLAEMFVAAGAPQCRAGDTRFGAAVRRCRGSGCDLRSAPAPSIFSVVASITFSGRRRWGPTRGGNVTDSSGGGVRPCLVNVYVCDTGLFPVQSIG